MTRAFAADIVNWRYPPPHDYYDMTDADPAFIADPASGIFALPDASTLIGFRSFGADSRVPGGNYDESALDTGGGLRPDLTGQALGRDRAPSKVRDRAIHHLRLGGARADVGRPNDTPATPGSAASG